MGCLKPGSLKSFLNTAGTLQSKMGKAPVAHCFVGSLIEPQCRSACSGISYGEEYKNAAISQTH